MSFSSLIDALTALRGRFQKEYALSRVLRHPDQGSTGVGVLVVSKPILAFGSSQCLPVPLGPRAQEPTTMISTIYRNTSDAAQTFLPPVQAVADIIPGVGGIIKGVIGGMLSTLQVVDRYIQNKGDMEQLTTRLHLLLRLIDNAPIARTTEEENTRWRLLRTLQTENSKLEQMRKRIRGSSSVTQDIAGCISRINNHLLDYTVFMQMFSQNEVHEIKANTDKIVQFSVRQTQFIENSMAMAGTRQLPASVSRGYAILVDATGREHPMLLDQCRYLDQLELMLLASLYQCRPDEAEIQRWYIERKQYDFVIYGNTDSDVMQLTRESDVWSKMEPGTKIVTRVIIEEEASWNMTATCTCRCGTPNTISVSVENLSAVLERGCTITCRHCERRFQVARTPTQRRVAPDDTDNQHAITTPTTEAKYLIRNFLAQLPYGLRVLVYAAIPQGPPDPPYVVSSFQFSTPPWLSATIVSLQAKYPDDRFEAILRKSSPEATPEWRIKCLDCPGKLFNPGPGDSLSNYEVHLKNQQHRLRVSSRIKGTMSQLSHLSSRGGVKSRAMD